MLMMAADMTECSSFCRCLVLLLLLLLQCGKGKVVKVSGITNQGRTATVLLRGSNKMVCHSLTHSCSTHLASPCYLSIRASFRLLLHPTKTLNSASQNPVLCLSQNPAALKTLLVCCPLNPLNPAAAAAGA